MTSHHATVPDETVEECLVVTEVGVVEVVSVVPEREHGATGGAPASACARCMAVRKIVDSVSVYRAFDAGFDPWKHLSEVMAEIRAALDA